MKAQEIQQKWTEYAQKHLVGRTIKAARYMTDEETEEQGWSRKAVVLELDDGTTIFPSHDDEGNGPGALFGESPTSAGREFLCCPVLW